jgi:hypothetical protein
MDRTLVAVFDSNDEARAACEALRQSGIPDDRVHLQSGTEFADADTSRDHRSWFSRLFSGSDVNDEHIGEYSESLRRGSCVVVVDAVDESRIDAAAQIMAQHHAIDMDERAAQWREQGWTGYDASAPAFPAEDRQRDRELYRNERMDTAEQRTNMTGEGATRIPVVEEVELGKEVSERTETVRDKVRRTNVEVEDLPGARTKEPDTAGRTRKRP